MKRIALHAGGFLFVLALVLAQWWGGTSQVEQAVAQPAVTVPFLEEWTSSGHADAEAEAFRHWDEDDPKQVPERCAKCHSSPGYLDFIGADGSEAGKVDKPASVDTVIDCTTCHNPVTLKMDSVVMPSGVEITGLGAEARCMQCHQGRASKSSVDGAIEELNLTDADMVNEELGFINIHYYAAAATKYGTIAKGGYEYEGKSYDANFVHVEGYESCAECHNPHTLKVRLDECSTCHTGLESDEDLKKIRMKGSVVDYDGDGDIEEGVYYEIVGLQELLYQAIQAYASEKTGKAIAYDVHSHPYFFFDTNGNGTADEEEVNSDNAFKAWTARLLKAAYNYQVSVKDPGNYAHGGKYIIQLLRDSLEDLNSVLSTPVEMQATHRIDVGHFAGSEEAFRHWDAEGEVPSSCTKCHQADGLPLFLKDNATISMPPSNGFKCTTCHNDLTTYSPYEVKEVVFPSGAKVTSEDANTNLCMNCHQGRVSTVQVRNATKGLEDDVVSEKLRFMNVHYFAAGATKFGTEAKGAYEYEGKEYVGLFKHVPNYAGCTSCHGAHELEINKELCSMCHQQVKDGGSVEAIRMVAPDYDGDGDTTEGVAAELDAMHEELYAAIQEYAKNVVKTAIVYDSHNYPYFFVDTDGNGQPDPDEANRDNGYNTWTPKLLKAAYNYQYVAKDPGGYAHNGKYIAQLLHDSLEDLGALKEGMARP